MDQENEIVNELAQIDNLLTSAKDYGLEAEVIHWALQAMKNNPTLSINEAFTIGFDEWIK